VRRDLTWRAMGRALRRLWLIAGQHEAERRWLGCRIVRWAFIVDVVLRSRERRAGEGWIGWVVR